jgi:tankyrase
MTGRRSLSSIAQESISLSPGDPLRDLFEACKHGDVSRVRALVTAQNVNARDTAGRKSSPLHFAAGIVLLV